MTRARLTIRILTVIASAAILCAAGYGYTQHPDLYAHD